MSQFIVVSGLPASGKTTVATHLSESLGLPLIDKDALLESLFQSVERIDVHMRRELSMRADQQLQELALRSKSAILSSWWKHPRSTVDSGSPCEWLIALPGRVVEVHCCCSPSLAVERFLSRKRHPFHLDSRWTHPDLLASFTSQSSLGPLGIGSLVTVLTELPIDHSALALDVERAMQSPSGK